MNSASNPAMPGKILEEYAVRNNRLGLVQFGDTRRPIFLDLVPDAKPGDYVLTHVGFATSRVDEAEAKRIYAELEKAGATENEEAALVAEDALPSMTRRQKPR